LGPYDLGRRFSTSAKCDQQERKRSDYRDTIRRDIEIGEGEKGRPRSIRGGKISSCQEGKSTKVREKGFWKK